METANRFRPLRLRRVMIVRPLWVLIRSRNPWVLLRETLLGWKVRFIFPSPAF
jgi:hypothetical protein